ncbi:nucleoside recognition protein [Roseburia sp. 1XD42-69]|jgi:spore maturation protein A|uniref:nucleoside recognition protein n=1 Tax=Roseburia sp. 1XD42-69 TaxID=2320088 RepID=UPI000EA1F922|nr:nucleoside recognition protein [Roseburia sp. 1XD42-69]RKJ63861.1 nucleoside recognition protein [Roseburia sp. 1XD42-69]
MNYLWGFMILIGVVYAAFTGNLPAVTEAAIDSAKEAVTLCITMMGVMSFWVGMMRIAQRAGIIQSATKKLMPLLKFLFPRIPAEHPANLYIATNMIANIFGLGWAATPAGLKAMECLEELRKKQGEILSKNSALKGMASNEMCIFLIINISSLQLIPMNVIAYRSQYGSVNPTAVIGPGILATVVSTVAAVMFCKVMDRKRRV